MSRHLVKEGNTIGWKENPTDGDYVLTYESPNSLGWKQGPGERTALTKDGELIGWRKIFSGEVMTEQHDSIGATVNHGWGNLPTISGGLVFYTEGFPGSIAWNPTLETYISAWSGTGAGSTSAKFGVDVHLEIEFTMGDGPFPQMIYKDDVPAGTEVSITGSSADGFFGITVRRPQGNFGHTHHFEGIIEVRATKL